MADPIAKALEDLNRTLKEQNRLLQKIEKALSSRQSRPWDTPPPEPIEAIKDLNLDLKGEPRTFGWSMAALAQREGLLVVGDRKIEEDESVWNWTGDIWERVEVPSARKPD